MSNTLLHWAVRSGAGEKAIRLILGQRREVNSDGQNPLIYLMSAEDDEDAFDMGRICSLLLISSKGTPQLDVDAKDAKGMTAFHRAAARRWRSVRECVEILLKHGADPTVTCDYFEHEGKEYKDLTASQIARAMGRNRMADVLGKAERRFEKDRRKKNKTDAVETSTIGRNVKEGNRKQSGDDEDGAGAETEVEHVVAAAEKESDGGNMDCNNANGTDEKSDGDEVMEKGGVEKEETEDEMIRRVAMEAIRKMMETFVWAT